MTTSAKSNDNDPRERLQKVLAACGIGSRRQCEELILEGRVDVDREVITQLGTRVDPESQQIRVDGVPLKKRRRKYFAVHKPPGVVSTSYDQSGRTRVIDLVESTDRVFTIGRLDKESSGLILVTSDGELANQLTHPRYQVPKTYHVTVAGTPSMEVLQKLKRGVVLSDGRVRPDAIKIKKRLKQSSILEIVLTEGRNREIRRMLARFDHKVLNLHRLAIGPIRLGELPKSAHRELTREEVRKLRDFGSGQKPARKRRRPAKRGGSKSVNAKAMSTRTGKRKAKRSIKSGTDFGQKMGAVLGGDSSKAGKKPGGRPKRRQSG